MTILSQSFAGIAQDEALEAFDDRWTVVAGNFLGRTDGDALGHDASVINTGLAWIAGTFEDDQFVEWVWTAGAVGAGVGGAVRVDASGNGYGVLLADLLYINSYLGGVYSRTLGGAKPLPTTSPATIRVEIDGPTDDAATIRLYFDDVLQATEVDEGYSSQSGNAGVIAYSTETEIGLQNWRAGNLSDLDEVEPPAPSSAGEKMVVLYDKVVDNVVQKRMRPTTPEEVEAQQYVKLHHNFYSSRTADGYVEP